MSLCKAQFYGFNEILQNISSTRLTIVLSTFLSQSVVELLQQRISFSFKVISQTCNYSDYGLSAGTITDFSVTHYGTAFQLFLCTLCLYICFEMHICEVKESILKRHENNEIALRQADIHHFTLSEY